MTFPPPQERPVHPSRQNRIRRAVARTTVLALAGVMLLAAGPRAFAANVDVDACIRVLENPGSTGQQREAALEKLIDAGPAASKAIPVLTGVLKTGTNLERDYATGILGQLGKAGGPALPALDAAARSDPDSDIRQLAAEAARKIRDAGGKPSSAEPARPAGNYHATKPTGTTGSGAAAGSSARLTAGGRLPAGYRTVAHKGPGTILVADLPAGKSATDVLREVVAAIADLFDAPPDLAGGVRNQPDTQAQGIFAAKFKGKAVRGLVFTGLGKRGAWAAVFVAEPESLAANLTAMVDAVRAQAPARVQWARQTLPGGAGWLTLPGGWRITGAANGAVDAVGPDGAEVDLGLAFTCNTPAYARQLAAMGIRGAAPVANYGRPQDVLGPVLHHFSLIANATGQPTEEVDKIIEVAPLRANRGRQAAYIHATTTRALRGREQQREVLYLVMTAPISNQQWMFYESRVSAPPAVFADDLPTLLAIWRGWKVSDKVFAQRMRLAMDSMSKVTEMIQQASLARSRATMSGAEAWDQVIRGYGYIINQKTGKTMWANSNLVTQLLKKLNTDPGRTGQWAIWK